MRRATAASSSSSSSARGLDQARTIARHEVRIRQLEASLALEQHRREVVEQKYVKLKRRHTRLERALADARGSTARGADALSPTLSSPGSGSISPIRPPRRQNDEQDDDDGDSGGDVIDLTSPVGSRRASLASPAATRSGMRNSQQALPSDDVIAESPVSPNYSAAVQPLERGSTGSATRRSTRVAARSSPSSDPLPPPAPPRVGGVRRRQLDFTVPDPLSRPRPRLGSNPSEQTPAGAARANHRRNQLQVEELLDRHRRRAATEHRSPDWEESISDPEPRTAPTDGEDSGEAASIALAQYLQQQENLAALEEYQTRLDALAHTARERERQREQQQQQFRNHHHLHDAPADDEISRNRGGDHMHDAAFDPDNMTYEELLQLGEDVGDVKKERWKRIAVQVLSSLPTHRWTTRSSEDLSCIICQYGFSIGDVALTLPCAHVFHEECVSGWVRENNSCPLCKLEIAAV